MMVSGSGVRTKRGVSRLGVLVPARACALCGLLTLLVAASAALGATWYVPDDFGTIQAALDSPAVVDGDTVMVAAGTYYENVRWKPDALGPPAKSIALIGATNIDPDPRIIDGGGISACFGMMYVPDTARVEGFTFTGGGGTTGGGVNLYRSSPTLVNNTVTLNSVGHSGGGICIGDSSPTLIDNTITANHSDNTGGGVYIVNGSSPTLIGNVITENSAEYGAGVYVDHSGGALIGNVIAGNTAEERGGGLALFRAATTLTGNTVTDNSAGEYGGGVFVQWLEHPDDPSPTLTNNLIARNTATYHGGGVWVGNSGPILTSNTIVDNQGGGFFHSQFNPQNPIITNCILFGNVGYDVSSAETCTVTYCDIGVGPPWVFFDPTNISIDPKLVDGGDYHLDDGSPCIDAGDNSAPSLPPTDKDGNERIVDGDGDAVAQVDLGAYEWQGPSIIEVVIDIKPGSYPNAINNDGHGVIPVAVLGSPEFDVRSISVETVRLEGLSIKVVGKASKEKLLYHYEDVDGDGWDDLVVQIQDEDAAFAPGIVTATLTGELGDGTPIVGADEIIIVPPEQ